MAWHSWTGLGERRWQVAEGEQVQPRKTLWDVLQLLIVPAILVVVTLAWSASQDRRDTRRADQERQDATLDDYIKQMSDLMLTKNLVSSEPIHGVRSLARVVTLTTLHRLDSERNGAVLLFLTEAGLLAHKRGPSVVLLRAADLRNVDFEGVDLSGVDLARADLRQADLSDADLAVANISGANLENADLRGADLFNAFLADSFLEHADLSHADLGNGYLVGAHLTYADLSDADLRYADLPDADLAHADLRHADLRHADLSDADLSDADLTDARLGGANLRGAKLEGAKGLS